MVRVRKLVLAIAAASALTSGTAHALGLGEVTMQSALNQPLVAEIELLEVRGLGTEDVVPTLASAEAFNRAGVDRAYFLTDLKFTPVIKPNGKSVIRVTSSKPVREPYLNFLVELHWPNGRLLREYTLLLDPPLYRPEPVLSAPISAPVSAPSAAPVRSVQPSAAPRAAASAPVRTASSSSASRAPLNAADGSYRTTSADTLWNVASRIPGGTVNQAMLAILDLNPNAFIDGNINRMKSGQVLRLPTEEQVRSRTAAEAQAQVAEQNAAWRERRAVAAPARQLDATRRTTAGAAPAETQASDNLRLVAADTGNATSGSDNASGTDGKGLEDKLAVAQESLDSTRRENNELQARMGELESRLENLQRLVQLKDDQLAKLQAELGDQPAAEAAAAEGAAVVPATAETEAPAAAEGTAEPLTDAPAEAVDSSEATAEDTVSAAAEAAADSVETPVDGEAAPAAQGEADAEVAAEGEAAPAVAAEAEPAVEAEPVVEPEPVKPAEVAPPKAAPAKQPVANSGSFLDELLENTTLMTLLGGGALLLLLLALMVLSRRNAQREAELHESLAAQQPLDEDRAPQNDFDPDAKATDAELAQAASQSGDALDEADIYIAYGRFNQAAELLQNAISEEPERNELRLKLMEVYAELGDREGFKREEQELNEIGGSHPEIEKLKARYPAMVAVAATAATSAATASLEEDFDLDDLGLDEEVTQPTASTADLDDAFDLSLSELETDLEAPEPLPSADVDLDFAEATSAVDEPLAEDPLADFDLDLDAPAAEEPAAASQALLDDDFAADLELPADFDLSLADAETPAEPASDEFLADLAAADAELNALSSDLESSVGELESLGELESFETAAEPVAAEAAADGDDFDFLSGTDETATKLDLARAYIDMGDTEGARDILDEVLNEGSDAQQNEARELLARLS